MDSRNALLAILGGVALTTLVGILLTPYRESSRQKKIVEKATEEVEAAGEKIAESAVNLKSRLKEMGEDAGRMVNEGGNTL